MASVAQTLAIPHLGRPMSEKVKYYVPQGELIKDLEPTEPVLHPWAGVVLAAILGFSMVATCGFTTAILYIIKTW